MASSDSNRNNGDQLKEEEEEYEEIEEEEEEYEEFEEEVEVEEEKEPEEEEEFEEVEEDEEEFEVEEVADEGKHEVEEVEEGVKDEIQEGKQEVVGEEVVDEEDVDEEEEYEDVDEEEEYEDVEEEEECEEVEVTDEEDATMGGAEFNDNGAGEINLAAKSLPVPFSSDTMCKDASQDVESEGNEVCLRSGDTGAINTEANIVHDAYAAEVLCPVEGSSSPAQMNDDGKVISSVAVGISKSPKLHEHVTCPLDNGSTSVEDKQGHVKQTVMVSASEKHASAPEAASDQLGKLDLTDILESKLLYKEADLHFPSKQSIDQTESRVRLRSSSPGGVCQEGNKRAAIICEFFARGWCIKGSSCRFLHKREHVDNATQVGDALPAEIELRSAKGSGDDADASGSTCGKDILMKNGEGLKLSKYEDKDKIALLEKTVSSSSFVSPHSQKPSSLKDGSRTLSDPRIEAEVFKGNHVFDNHDLPIPEAGSMLRQNFFPRCGFSTRELGVASSSDPLLRLVEESATMRKRYSLDFQSSAPPYHFSSWKRTSLLHNSSLLSGSDPATISKSYAKDQPISFNYKTTFTPYNWEPSVPFRSSYFIPPVKRSSDIQYDPFRDSIEQPNVEHASFNNSSYGNTQDVQSISRRNPLELHKVLRSDSWAKNYSTHDKVIPEVEAESAATSDSDVQSKKIVEEENPMVPGSVKDILKASRSVNDGSSKMSDLLRNGEMKVNGLQPNELDDEESKAIKYFRTALIEFVKELMKPIWHEGRLSKDVYKAIVQKAEDKILSTLQPEQVPRSSESIKQYLSSSRPKIMKLIQAYVDKYGKF